MCINPVNEAEVIRIIKLCKPKDSMDHDDICMWVLSRIAPHVVKPLVHIFNLSFSTVIFPSEVKIAKVIPLFRNGNTSYFSNYRQRIYSVTIYSLLSSNFTSITFL